MPGDTSSSLTLARSDHDYESGLSSTLGSSFSHLFFASGFWVLSFEGAFSGWIAVLVFGMEVSHRILVRCLGRSACETRSSELAIDRLFAVQSQVWWP